MREKSGVLRKFQIFEYIHTVFHIVVSEKKSKTKYTSRSQAFVSQPSTNNLTHKDN